MYTHTDTGEQGPKERDGYGGTERDRQCDNCCLGSRLILHLHAKYQLNET